MPEILGKIMSGLKMHEDSFYPMIISLLPVLISAAYKLVKSVAERQEKKGIIQLYCKIENSFFYISFLFCEVVALVIGFVASSALLTYMLKFPLKLYIYKMSLSTSMILFVSMVFLLIKTKWVKKEVIGDKKGRIILISSIACLDVLCFSVVFEIKFIINTFSLAYYLIEIIGLYHFRARYKEYRFSKVNFYLTDESKVLCEDIEKVRRKGSHIIVDNENNVTVIPYDKIQRAEYFGAPKIVLINKKKRRKK